MRAPLHIAPRSWRLTALFLATMPTWLLAACGGESSSATPDAVAGKSRNVTAELEWRRGDEHSFISHRADRQIIRCWAVQGEYDCLVAHSIGLKDIIPGAPGRLEFFRFQAGALPPTQEAVDRLASSDGYACELTDLPGRTLMTETYWRRGRIKASHATDLDAGGGWKASDVKNLAANGGTTGKARPFFECTAVIAPVRDVGLYALDSGLISYDPVFTAVDYSNRGLPLADASETPK